MAWNVGSSERADWPLAVVVGAGAMGMAIARRLGQRNRLLLVDISGEHAQQQAKLLRAGGHDAVAMACDITNDDAVRLLAAAVKDSGPFRTLAQVAGLSPGAASAIDIIAVNLAGAVRVTAALEPLAGPGSSAILVASLAAHLGQIPETVLAEADRAQEARLFDRLETALGHAMSTSEAYRISKQAMLRYCRTRATSWGQRGARIVSLSPGMIATPMGALEFQKSPQKYDILKRTPLQREGTMLEIGDAVEFLVSDRASFITGTDLLVDGGAAAASNWPQGEAA